MPPLPSAEWEHRKQPCLSPKAQVWQVGSQLSLTLAVGPQVPFLTSEPYVLTDKEGDGVWVPSCEAHAAASAQPVRTPASGSLQMIYQLPGY